MGTGHLSSEPRAVDPSPSELIAEDWIDRPYIDAYTEGFDQFAESLQTLSLSEVAATSGVSSKQLRRIAKRFTMGDAPLSGGQWALTRDTKQPAPLKRS
jgi:anaerobic selenocysteine-containing dehydrogenase